MMGPTIPRVLFAVLILAGWDSSRAVRCLDGRDFQQNLPGDIGKRDSSGNFAFAFQCDTVFVRKGVTTTVYPGTHLYFAKTSLNSVIKVEGTLILKGTKNSYVYLSGSLDTAKGGMSPGEKLWGGIEVSEGGKLLMEFTGMARAPTPITAFSRNVKIVNSFFKGSSGMILPDGSLVAMDSKWDAVNDLDLSKAKDASDAQLPGTAESGGLSKAEKAALLEGQKPGRFWTWPKVAGGAALLALAAGTGFYLLQGDEEQTPKNPPRNPTLDPEPPLPNSKTP